MPHYRRANTGRNYRYHSYNSGREHALQHIREAEELSRQLGGTDRDVKEYFFSLSRGELQAVLDLYGKTFGRDKREYAEKAFHEWKSGTKKMSGLVAGRLFNLLPPLMPFEKKYNLVANLWREMGPSSHKVLKIGPNADIETIVEWTRAQVMETVKNYTIPERLQQRFQWLTMGDVQVQQQLMNHLLEMEKNQTVELTRLQVPPLLDHIRNRGDHTHRLAQVLQIGKHKFEVLYEKNASGVTLENPTGPSGRQWQPATAATGNTAWRWLWWVVGALGLLLWLLSRGH